MRFVLIVRFSHLQMFGATGVGLAGTKYIENNGKPPRRSVDAWDRVSALCEGLHAEANTE